MGHERSGSILDLFEESFCNGLIVLHFTTSKFLLFLKSTFSLFCFRLLKKETIW